MVLDQSAKRIGASVEGGSVRFRVWAPDRARVDVAVEGRGELAMERCDDGFLEAKVEGVGVGARYRYRLDGGEAFADPASRSQPDGPFGASEVIDPRAYAWKDGAHRGVDSTKQVVYEMHVGTFTNEGTWRAAIDKLPLLVDVGVTCVEMMPVADFFGRFGWGYDGVGLFAPTRLYGNPDDLRAFVDAAHALGLGVILDVVYNHCGPVGCFLDRFSQRYFSDRYPNEWGKAMNFDGEGSEHVRAFFVANARMWIDEYHFDGLRLDATQSMFDASPRHIVAEIAANVRDAAKGRATFVVAENEPQHALLVRPEARGGYGVDALWNDDFHHTAIVALTGRDEAYYSDHRGSPQEILSALKWGYLLQGQRYRWQDKARGTNAFDVDPRAFVVFLENHDQVANSARGLRLSSIADRGRLRAMTAVTLLAPNTPMLFQGQEWGSTRPFLYFADHEPDLAKAVRAGRREFLLQFPSLNDPPMKDTLADPSSRATFEACKLDWSERERERATVDMHKDLLALRRSEGALASPSRRCDGAVLGAEAFVVRFFAAAEDRSDDRLLLVNLGRRLVLDAAPEPLLAPPDAMRWIVRWSSEDPRYGGQGTEDIVKKGFVLPAHSAVLLAPAPASNEGRS